MPPHSIPEILDDLRAGKMIVLADDQERENEGDLVIAAEKVTPEAINFMVREARGLVCLALTEERADALQLPLQTPHNTSTFGTAFTVSVDAREGVTTGVSAADRARTILKAVSDDCRPEDLARPGHVLPLRARNGGVLVRTGQTEGSVDLCRLAGLKPAAVICEIMNEDGTMARRPQLDVFCRRHGLKMCFVDDIISYRHRSERLIVRQPSVRLPTVLGEFTLHTYNTTVNESVNLALCVGEVGRTDAAGQPIECAEPVLVRVHSQCLTGDTLLSVRCDCRDQLHTAMRMVQKAGCGVVLYMSQEGRGIGLGSSTRCAPTTSRTAGATPSRPTRNSVSAPTSATTASGRKSSATWACAACASSRTTRRSTPPSPATASRSSSACPSSSPPAPRTRRTSERRRTRWGTSSSGRQAARSARTSGRQAGALSPRRSR